MFLSRRHFLQAGVAASANLVSGASANADDKPLPDVHQQLLELAAKQEEERRKQFAAVTTRPGLEALQQSLRTKFLTLLDGLPERKGPPPVRTVGKIDGDDYTVEKLIFESLPNYFVSALLYRPKQHDGKRPGIISPCGHAAVGKAAGPYQALHINLAKRGHVVLTYDPVGQGERSQFWDAAKGKSRFNLSCGEHAVLGNPLYLLGTSLARYRIHDGMRAIDYLAALPEVDPERIGCVGSSGGGTLTAYIAALDARVRVAVPSCYITTLPRRMANRIQRDPDADPEQDIYGFVSEGIDHAGLLALRVPRPTQISAAKQDFFPIEGARESFAEVKRLYEVAGAANKFAIAEADERHGLTLALRQAAYAWFDRWLADRKDIRADEIPVKPRPTSELLVTADGQVNVALQSRPLLPLALEEFKKRAPRPRAALKETLRLAPEPAFAVAYTGPVALKDAATLVLCVNGNEARPWQEEKPLLEALAGQKIAVNVIDPRGVGKLRPNLEVKGHDYADPLNGVEANIAYNAFLVGQSLLGLRVADVLAALAATFPRPRRIVLSGRRDAALVACLAAALEPLVQAVATEEMLLSYVPLFEPAGQPINAASILPRLLRDVGDIPDVLESMAPRKVLAAAPQGKLPRVLATVQVSEKRFSGEPDELMKWLKG